MSRKIIIVTEHGYDYDRDGQLFITNAMKDQYGVAAQTHFFSGPLFCKIKSIVGAIELPHEDTFVIWAKDSTDTEAGSLRIFPPETLDQLANLFKLLTKILDVIANKPVCDIHVGSVVKHI